jgi:hypothetical protein
MKLNKPLTGSSVLSKLAPQSVASTKTEIMKKLILCLAMAAFAISLQAGEKKDKSTKSSCPSPCCAKAEAKDAKKVEAPKAADKK